MIRFVALGSFAVASLIMVTGTEARNTPCSGSKGGVKACQGTKFLCEDGSISASKRSCGGSGGGGGVSDSEGGGSGSGGSSRRGRRR